MKNYITNGKQLKFNGSSEWRDIRFAIDPEDWDRVSKESWHFHTDRCLLRSRKLGTSLHKFILNITDEYRTAYHIDGNVWNNKKSNLVECSIGEAVQYNRAIKIIILDMFNMRDTYKQNMKQIKAFKSPVSFL